MNSEERSTGIRQFKGEGFEYWKFRVQTYLEMKGVKKCLTEALPTDETEKKAFVAKDVVAKHLIVSFIADDHLEVVQEKTTAKEMWDALNTTFGKSGAVSQHLLRRQLIGMKMQNGEAMTEFFSRFDKVVRELKASGAKLEQDDIISHLTINLPACYDALVTALENVPNLTLELVKSRLLSEEQKMRGREGDVEPKVEVGFMSKGKGWMNDVKCYNCNKKGHFSSQCTQKAKGDRHEKKQLEKQFASMSSGTEQRESDDDYF